MPNKTIYTKELKLEVVRQLEKGDIPGTDLARELGIRRNLLYKWQTELKAKGDKAFRGPGRNARKENKVADLERENEKLREEVEILKKAAVDSTSQCNTLFHDLLRRSKFQYFSGSFI